MPYALGWLTHQGERCVVAATEDHGPVVISRPPFERAEVLVPGPGGCMSLLENPRKPGELFSIMGCFLGYNFHGGAVYRIAGGTANKLIDLPFGHRLEIVDRPDGRFLLASNLASTKDSPQDWTRPGSLYALPLDTEWKELGTPVLENLNKHHGMFQGTLNGRPTFMVSAQQGVFSLDLRSPGWAFARVLDHEVSEIALFDLDGDGNDELVTIEPFHGNVLAVYKAVNGHWSRTWDAELDYGHCVIAGLFQNRPSVLVSSRAGNKDLVWWDFSASVPQKTVVAEGVGTANLLVAKALGEDIILATNQARGELVRYSPA